jgi:two-component system CheB/CheR fusion protein
MAMDNDKEPSESKRMAALQDKVNYCDCIIATLREPFIVLDHDLRIKTANRSFYVAFRLSPEDTENQLIYDLDNRQWDIPQLRGLLDQVLSDKHPHP